jgi:hypothetical protein
MELSEKKSGTSHLKTNEVDKKTINNIKHYSSQESAVINERLRQLEDEWDIERVLQINTGLAAFSGALLGTFNKRWYILPGIAAAFLAQYAIKGWAPPIGLLRTLGFRSRKEIEQEKYALKTLRGDFDDVYDHADAWRAVKG